MTEGDEMIGGTRLTRRAFLWAGGAAVAAAGLPKGSWAQDGKVLKLRALQDLQVLDPGWMIGGIEIDLQYACLGALAVFQPGESLGWRPSAFVTRLEQPDDLHIEFELKPGIKWSGDNGELTAEDVKYSFERLANPANEAPWKDKWSALQEVQVTGTHSGVIVLARPSIPLWFTTICDGTGSIVCKKATEAAGGRFTSEFPAVCGPYRVKQWLQKQRIELERNPDWIGEAPAFDEVHFYFIEDAKAAELAYEAGDVDYVHVELSSLARYQENPPADSTIFEAPGLSWTWMGMNTEHPKLSDIRVRQAIQNAVDVSTIIDASYGGVPEARARGIVPRGMVGHRTTTAFEKPDPDKARALLAEAGAEGLELELKILNETVNLSTAQIIQANLAEVGINVVITPLDSGPFWNLGLESEGEDWKDLQLWIMRYQDAPDPSQQTQWYVSDQVGVWNWERWKDPEFDELHVAALAERDSAKRAEMYLRMQDIMEATGAYVWIAHEPAVVMYRNTMVPSILPPDHPYVADFKPA
jgi:peptide/nickel transport system substrate-binding protein